MAVDKCKAKMFNFVHFINESFSPLYSITSFPNLDIYTKLIKIQIQILYLHHDFMVYS